MCHTICLLPVKTIPCSCHNTLYNNCKGKRRPKQYKRKGMIHFGKYWETELFLLEAVLSSNRNPSVFDRRMTNGSCCLLFNVSVT